MQDKRVVMAEQAKKHKQMMINNYTSLIQKTANNTIQYSEHLGVVQYKELNKPKVIIEDANLYDTLTMHYTEGKVAVVSPASFLMPGGSFLDGGISQEELLCHYSILFNVLDIHKDFYVYNNSNKNRGLYSNRALYIPDLLFCSKTMKFTTNVISCSPPNCTGARFKDIVTREENIATLRSRINYVLKIADINKIDTLVIGPFGCGHSQQKSEDVATILYETVFGNKHNFSKLIISAPNNHNKIFMHTFRNPQKTILFA